MPQQTVELIEGQQITVDGVTVRFDKAGQHRQGREPAVSVASLTISTPDPEDDPESSEQPTDNSQAD